MFDSGPFDRHCREKCTISPWYEIPPGYLPGELTAYLPCLLTLFNLLGKPSRPASLRSKCSIAIELIDNLYVPPSRYGIDIDIDTDIRRPDLATLVFLPIRHPSIRLLPNMA